MTDKKVVTLQDISCMGQCSLTVALPIISACGVETIILPSAVLSTHTGGFTGYTFRDLTEDIPGIMNHWKSENIRFDCLYTGYLGSITQIEYVGELKKNVVKEGGLLIVDPAMADNGSLYYGFDQAFVERMAQLCGTADIILPNLTEAAFMTGSELKLEDHSEEYVTGLLEKLAGLGAKKVILKGISYEPGKIGVAVYDSASKNLQYYFTEKVNASSHGTGDCYAAAFTGALMQGKDEITAAAIAADFVVESIKQTIGDEHHKYGVKFERALPMLVKELNH
ncbi:MAG: pyridoxamine kinase [Lachnospiraceae bacterium]|nr:pyridoxamine kinase [Lachnospiraceae bacterium]